MWGGGTHVQVHTRLRAIFTSLVLFSGFLIETFQVCCSHFTDEDTGSERLELTFPRSPCERTVEFGIGVPEREGSPPHLASGEPVVRPGESPELGQK